MSKTTGFVANSVDPDQTPHFAASDLGLHCFPCLSVLIVRVITVIVQSQEYKTIHSAPYYDKIYFSYDVFCTAYLVDLNAAENG